MSELEGEAVQLTAEELFGIEHTAAYIRKVGNEWCVFSESGKRMGCRATRKEAVDRLRQIEYFKHQGMVQGSFEVKENENDPRNKKIESVAPENKATAADLLSKNTIGEVNI